MRRISAFLVLVALLLAALPASAQTEPGGKTKSKVSDRAYIIQMVDEPVVTYSGGVPGLKATRPNKGQKIDPNSPDVVAYVSYLDSRHNQALAKVGGAGKLYDYRYSFNGFSAKLTAEQAAALAGVAGVVSVSPDEIRQLDTVSTPTFLGLNATGGFWDQLGGVNNAGEGIILGDVDSGIWPEHPSLSDRTGANGNGTQDGKLNYQQIPGWHGKCTPGEEFVASNCNQKLIGAQWFNAGFGGDAAVKAAFPYEYASARDADGHGTHTATTAAGNNNVAASADGIALGSISGMAPRARVASYKVCWGRGGEGGCATSDSVAAIDQAVADGVDVINFSISGSLTSNVDPVEVAFLYAASAGVFVSASAGNSGPTAATVAHNSPWLTTVAAGTHDRLYIKSVTLGNGTTYTGVGLGAAVPSSPLILSTTAGLPGKTADEVRLCFSGALDPAVVTGKIVVCDRGSNARTDKSLAVQMAGGVGMVLVNTSPNSINADLHYVPTVHLNDTDRAAVVSYAATPGATASISETTLQSTLAAPDVASFSSRGPARAAGSNLLKPDIMAPGQDILAGVSPAGYGGREFDFLSGTSMSSPHIAGIGLLMKQAHPDWTPAMIKSALMTTATQTRNDGKPIAGGAFAYGAGQVVPNKGIDPGLVYNAGWNDWLTFLCVTKQIASAGCASKYNLFSDPSDLNYPSIAISALTGSKTVTRTLTNVSGKTTTYNVSVATPAGFAVTVTPSTLTFKPGESKSYSIKLEVTNATLNAYAQGALTWVEANASQPHLVRSPIVVRPVALSVPGSVVVIGSDPYSFNAAFGYSGAFGATVSGLVPAATQDGLVMQDPQGSFDPNGQGVTKLSVTVDPGVKYARFSLFNAYTNGNNDLDLYVYYNGTQVGASGGGTADEEVNLTNPAAGTYDVYVHGYSTPASGATFTLFVWQLNGANAGNMTVTTPASVTVGSSAPVTLNFNGLVSGPKSMYLGQIFYTGAVNLSAYSTFVRVQP